MLAPNPVKSLFSHPKRNDHINMIAVGFMLGVLQGRNDLAPPDLVIIYKVRDNEGLAWEDAEAIKNVRVELHNQKSQLLDALKLWRAHIRPDNSFIAIYSHMNANGMAPEPGSQFVSWQELSTALAPGVQTMWLIGCESFHVLRAWPTPRHSPVMGTLLVTSTGEKWRELIAVFEREVSLNNIAFFDQMEDEARSSLPGLRESIRYYHANGDRWDKSPA